MLATISDVTIDAFAVYYRTCSKMSAMKGGSTFTEKTISYVG